jgi:hypothetical protein
MNSRGSGIGLYSCQAILKIIGPCDKFFIDSKVGLGTTFSFFIYIDSNNQEIKNSI